MQAQEVVEALDAAEIKKSLVIAFSRMLDSSCDLRDGLDAYGGGFSVESIKIQGLKLYSMDIKSLDFETSIPATAPPPVSTDEVTVTPVVVNLETSIPLEEDLTVVRDQIANPEPAPEPEEAAEVRMPARLKRKYTRRLATPEMNPMGGAVDLDTPDDTSTVPE